VALFAILLPLAQGFLLVFDNFLTCSQLIDSFHEIWPVNPLSANSDENEICLYIITTFSNIQAMRIKEVITKDKMSRYLDKSSLLVS